MRARRMRPLRKGCEAVTRSFVQCLHTHVDLATWFASFVGLDRAGFVVQFLGDLFQHSRIDLVASALR